MGKWNVPKLSESYLQKGAMTLMYGIVCANSSYFSYMVATAEIGGPIYMSNQSDAID